MVKRVHKYADGGKVVMGKPIRLTSPDPEQINKAARKKPGFKVNPPGRAGKSERAAALRKRMVRQEFADGGKVKAKPKKPDPKMLGTGAAAKAGKALRDTRKKQMEDLGI